MHVLQVSTVCMSESACTSSHCHKKETLSFQFSIDINVPINSIVHTVTRRLYIVGLQRGLLHLLACLLAQHTTATLTDNKRNENLTGQSQSEIYDEWLR